VLAADLVLLATGVLANDELAGAAGLPTNGGILVDRFMTTADPAIFAIGDCAVFESPFADGLVRLESVQNAIDQAKCVAARILGGTDPYRSVPWFWSDQGSFKLQIAGITTGADHVHLAGSREDGRLVAYCFRGERLLGIETVNRPSEHMLGRRVLEGDLKVMREDVSAEAFDLKRHLAALAAGA
jgi:3-phenylpropionate/trans-cinnamate dioxygenase ferredoxin reductase subunit